MGYAYEDLAEAQFESLVVQAAKLVLGKGVQGFATGVDGGRDARFEGLADGFPSSARPWDGLTIIQAKHSMSGGYFSDSDFSGESESSVLSVEIPRIRKLRESGMLDNYLLYSNRFLTANSNEAMVRRLAAAVELNTENIHLCGVEALNEAFRLEPRLPQLAGINPLDGPLVVSSRDLAEVVEAIANLLDAELSTASSRPQRRTSLAVKNELNSMTEAMSRRLMKLYGPLLSQIKTFLAEPGNSRIRQLYDDCATDFDMKIVAYREERHTFDKVIEHLFDLLVARDPLLGRHRKLTRAVVFYMYWNCDIGDTEEDPDALSVEA